MENIEDIKNKVLKVKNFLDVLKGKYLQIEYNPINDFYEKENYPLDFQIYMKEIGELSIGSDPRKEYSGYAVLEVISPTKLDQMKENNFDEPYHCFLEYEECEEKDVFSDKVLTSDINFVAIEPCYYNAYGYIKKDREYFFCAEERGFSYKIKKNKMTFMNWLAICLISHVEHIINAEYACCNEDIKDFLEYKNLKKLDITIP